MNLTLENRWNWTGSRKLFTYEMLKVENQASQKVYWHHTSFVNYLEKLGGYSGTFSFGIVGLGTTQIYATQAVAYFGTGRLRMVQMGRIRVWGRLEGSFLLDVRGGNL